MKLCSKLLFPSFVLLLTTVSLAYQASIPPHKMSSVKWNGIHIGSPMPINDPAIKQASGCSYMGEGLEEFSKMLLALSMGKTMSVCRLIADCPPPPDSPSPVKVCSEDLNHAWVSQIWVVTIQPYSEVRGTLESTYGPPMPGLHRLLSKEYEPGPSYNLWQLQEGIKIWARQDSVGNLRHVTSSEMYQPVSVVYIIE
jgi:hypothetical protein